MDYKGIIIKNHYDINPYEKEHCEGRGVFLFNPLDVAIEYET